MVALKILLTQTTLNAVKKFTAILGKPEDALYNDNIDLPELTKQLKNFLQFHNTQVCVVTVEHRNSNQHDTPLAFDKNDSDSHMDQPFPDKLETNTSQQQ